MKSLRAGTTTVVISSVLFLAPCGFAAVIPVDNPSFETPPSGGIHHPCAGPGCFFSTAVIPGWNNNPAISGQLIPSTVGPNRFFNETAPGNESTSAYVNASGTISQKVGTVQQGLIYTLTLEIGHVRDENFGVSADLLLSSLGHPTETIDATGTTPTLGNWSNFKATFIGTAANAGDSITIQLRNSGPGNQGNFDSVKLTAVPVPAFFGVVGIGLAGLLAFARRNRCV